MARRSKPKNPFKHLNSRRKRLADGSWVTYWYAFKGGPRLPGEYGSPEFVEAYAAAHRERRQPPDGVIFSLLAAYQQSTAFTGLAKVTRRDYIAKLKLIEQAFGDFPLSALTDRRTRGEFLAWRDRLAISSPRQADLAFSVLARVLSWAKDRGAISVNPCERAGRLYSGSRADRVWTAEDEAAFLRVAPEWLRLPLLLALWTGQRQGDLLALTWFAYDGNALRLRQSKTGRRVYIPVGKPHRDALDALPRHDGRILLNSRGQPWTADGFRSSFAKIQRKAGITGLTFHDLRGTAVTRLSVAGCTPQEVATLTGHSVRDVHTILDRHYLNRDQAMAESAIKKLETGTQIPD